MFILINVLCVPIFICCDQEMMRYVVIILAQRVKGRTR